MRRLLIPTISLLLIGCGGSENPSTPTVAELGLQRADQARTCLSDAGFQVTGGPRAPGDRDAPDVELVVNGGGAGAFVGYYKAVDRAKRLESDLRRNARRFNGSVERRGPVSVVWVRRPSPDERGQIEGCVF